MALLALLLLMLPAAPISRLARRVAAGSAATLFASTLPIATRIAHHDPEVALVAPVMSLLRAAGLLTGTMAGLARFRAAPPAPHIIHIHTRLAHKVQ